MTTIEANTELRPAMVRCPRCGYDQRGIVATWAESCPLEGTCSECGLTFKWAEVLCPEKYEPRWCVEFIVPLRRFPAAAVKTFLRSFTPWRFWRQLRMSMPIRRRRLAAYVVLLLMPLLIGYVLVQTSAAVRTRIVLDQDLQSELQWRRQQIPQLQQWLADYESADVDELSFQDRFQMQSLRQQIQAYQTSVAAGYTINHSPGAAILEAVFTPWRSSSSGTITARGAVLPYVAPRDLHLSLARPGVNWKYDGPMHYLGFWTTWLGMAGLVAFFLLPAGFVLLPVSRRRAKVRWRHIWSVTAYAAFIPSAALTAMLLCLAAGDAITDIGEQTMGMLRFIARWFIIAALIVWWAMAIGRYLKIPHGWAVAAALTVITMLLYLGAWWLLAPGMLVEALVDL